MRPNAFPRTRRLKRRRLIRPLFGKGQAEVIRVRHGTLLLLARWVDQKEVGERVPFQVGFAPGHRRTNVLRTRVRRFLREAFRQNQSGLLDLDPESSKVLTAMILFRGRGETASEDIRRDMPEAVEKLIKRINPHAAQS